MLLKISSSHFANKPVVVNSFEYPKYEFHIAKDIRKKYKFDNEIFSITGNVVFADFQAVRVFTHKINSKRDDDNKVRVGEVNAFGLLDEIFHHILREYETKQNPGVFNRAVEKLKSQMGEDAFRGLIFEFISIFPPMDVYQGKITSHQYLEGFTGSKSNYEIALEEMMLLYFSNFNPANKKLKELFDENYLSKKNEYHTSIKELDTFFQSEKEIGIAGGKDIFSFLKMPMLNNPNSIEDQLGFIKDNWGVLLDAEFLKKILKGQDLSREDFQFMNFGGGGGAPTVVPSYKGIADNSDMFVLGKSGYKYAKASAHDYDEPEAFTKDIDWMPSVVILAKNTYVWLDQLSKKYQREIRSLDQVPDEELDELVRRNFTGLWLIGLWERSHASKEIKHRMGNIDAVASAYSLYDYTIAADLGGEQAYENLHQRASHRGLRLASDMVPNHTGICSEWMKSHPDYFIQSDYSPFPNYTFNGENLSRNPEYEIRIEDGYWNKTDAAVVFQRRDTGSGHISYIYHGNDGTNMPWNDTAQLNMMKKEVREAVIQKIFDVARKFSIIRFDAAMTLTKRHFSRLWFPEPGTGGDIPSRSDHALTKDEFDNLFPEEFWREVVDRINAEMPETLLLAEAFWLMEGYFVRSLGMHRVYNSAFMHMMMNEENEKYRDLITNTLEFEPEILKRYVNFISNPDEETAIRQFGTDDKYFGVCTLMVTLPGLPMFAHGQIEGFTEKYGMEYKRAYYNEEPKQWLIDRHYHQIFPLMRKRHLFSQVRNFWFFDFIDGVGEINENVFAFTNFEYAERALVLYNNRFEQATGTIIHSTPKLVGENKDSQTKHISEALNIRPVYNVYYIYRDIITNLQYIKCGEQIAREGIHFYLNGFETKVFIDFEEVFDTNGEYAELANHLNGNGVADVKLEIQKRKLSPIHEAFENIFDPKEVKKLVNTFINDGTDELITETELKFINNRYLHLLNFVKKQFAIKIDFDDLLAEFNCDLRAVRVLNNLLQNDFSISTNPQNALLQKSFTISSVSNYRENGLLFLLWLTISKIRMLSPKDPDLILDELLLDYPVKNILRRLGRGEVDVYKVIALINVLLKYKGDLLSLTEFDPEKVSNLSHTELLRYVIEVKSDLINDLLRDDFVHAYIDVNYYQGVYYYSKEKLEELLDWMLTLTMLKYLELDLLDCRQTKEKEVDEGKAEKGKIKKEKVVNKDKLTSKAYILKSFMIKNAIKQNSTKAGYKLDELKSKVNEIVKERDKELSSKKTDDSSEKLGD